MRRIAIEHFRYLPQTSLAEVIAQRIEKMIGSAACFFRAAVNLYIS